MPLSIDHRAWRSHIRRAECVGGKIAHRMPTARVHGAVGAQMTRRRLTKVLVDD
jgi:hypothetical protein